MNSIENRLKGEKRARSRKAQTALVVMIVTAILLIVGLAIVSVVVTRSAAPKVTSLDVLEVRSLVEECVKLETYDAAFRLALQGGTTTPKQPYQFDISLDNGTVNTSIDIESHYYLGEVNIPTDEEVQKEIALLLERGLEECADLDSLDYEIIAEKPKAHILLLDDGIRADVDWPITVKKGSQEKKLTRISKTVPVYMRDTLFVAKEILEDTKVHPEYIDIGYLVRITPYMDIDVFKYPDNRLVYVLHDQRVSYDGLDFVFEFANKVDA